MTSFDRLAQTLKLGNYILEGAKRLPQIKGRQADWNLCKLLNFSHGVD